VTVETTAEPLIATFDAPGVDEDTLFVFKLTAGDATETLFDEDVRITVKNLVTTAVAGVDQQVAEGTEATLDGSGSLTTSGSLTYAWTQTVGPPVTLSEPNSTICGFTTPAIWAFTKRLTFRLEVNDGVGGVSTDEVSVYVTNTAFDLQPLGTGYFQDLLHLGQTPEDRFTAPLDQSLDTNDYLANWGGQANVNPVEGEEYDFTGTGITTTSNPMVWTPEHTDNGVFMLDDQYLGRRPGQNLDNFGQIYHIYIFSPEEREARIHFRHDDEIRIWNNGAVAAARNDWDGDAERSQNFVLDEGVNSMTLRFEEGGGDNYIAARVSDRDNIPYADLSYALSVPNPLPRAYAVRSLPGSYQPGGAVDVDLSVRADLDNRPDSVTVSEVIPAGLTVGNAGGGQVIGGTLNWNLTGDDVGIHTISYSLNVPGEVTGALNFEGTVSYTGQPGQDVLGDKAVYEIPAAPQNLDVEMLLAAHVSWSGSPQEGVVGYRIYSSVNGQAWQEIAYVSGTSYTDSSVVPGSTYKYKVAAVNRAGVEGTTSSPTDEKMITMLIREAEDYNYGGGQYPGYRECPAAIEAPSSDQVGTPQQYDFYFNNSWPVGDPARSYRPEDDVFTEMREDTPNIGGMTIGDWHRYTFDVPPPGPGDPPDGWVKIAVKVAGSSGTASLYWDEVLVANLSFATGGWADFTHVATENYFKTTPGEHTLRVVLASGGMNIDKIGMGFNWSPPKRRAIFEDDFEDYTTLYVPDDAVAAGWIVENGSGYADARWRLWNTAAAEWLGNESPDIAGVTNNYMITDADLAPEAAMDEGLLTPQLDCTNWIRLRLDFSKNFRIYPDDIDHLQVGEVDIRTYDEETSSWGGWVNLLHYDRNSVADINSSPEQVDLSAYDEKKLQIRWHFHQATYDYWFAVDDIVLSGEMKEIPSGQVLDLGLVGGKVELTWEEFGGGNYTVEYSGDLTSGNWQPVPGVAWPITETTWPGESIGALPTRYYRVRSE
jgi:hypothetical protein